MPAGSGKINVAFGGGMIDRLTPADPPGFHPRTPEAIFANKKGLFAGPKDAGGAGAQRAQGEGETGDERDRDAARDDAKRRGPDHREGRLHHEMADRPT